MVLAWALVMIEREDSSQPGYLSRSEDCLLLSFGVGQVHSLQVAPGSVEKLIAAQSLEYHHRQYCHLKGANPKYQMMNGYGIVLIGQPLSTPGKRRNKGNLA